MNSKVKLDTVEEKNVEIEPKFIFDERSKNEFINGLKSDEISKKIKTLLGKNDVKAFVLGNEIKSILVENAKKCNVKTAKAGMNSTSAPWFDKECSQAKQQIQKLGKKLKNDPFNQEIRNSLTAEKRCFKKLATHKKRKYKQNITDKMSKSHKNQKEFWKLLDKLSEKKPTTSYTCPIIPSQIILKHY